MRGACSCACLILGAAIAFGQVAKPQFDAASVKVVVPDGCGGGRGGPMGGPGTSDPGHFVYPVVTMVGLLMKAWGFESAQVIGPAWMREAGSRAFYEVRATMPVDTTEAQFQAMMQNLLADRFHLVAHHESRNFPGYELVVDGGGSKVKTAMPQPEKPVASGPSNFVRRGVGNISINGATMEEFAGRLARALWTFHVIGTQEIDAPTPRVVDKTGLTGKYDFALDFSEPGYMAGPGDEAAGLPDLFTALRKQLGLRLNKTADVPVDAIVVDEVDKVPTEN